MARNNRKSSKNGKRRVVPRTGRGTATRVLAQGAAAYPTGPFGSAAYTTDPKLAFDATCPMHLPLPRAVAPYTILRVTRTLTSADRYVMFGTFYGNIAGESERLLSCVGLHSASGVSTVGTTSWTTLDNDQLGLFGSTHIGNTYIPAALTVQVMCTDPINTASGLVRGTLLRQAINLHDQASTVENWYSSACVVNPPRLMTAGKMALRGVVANAVPMNMSKLSDFVVGRNVASAVTPSTDYENFTATGMTPIIIENTGGANLAYVVTTEYRVRFEAGLVAAATHVSHPATPLPAWNRCVELASKYGHGIQDIAETIANTGAAIGRAAYVAKALKNVMAPEAALAVA